MEFVFLLDVLKKFLMESEKKRVVRWGIRTRLSVVTYSENFTFVLPIFGSFVSESFVKQLFKIRVFPTAQVL